MPNHDRGRTARLSLGSIELGELTRKLDSLTPLGYGADARVEIVLTVTDLNAPTNDHPPAGSVSADRHTR